MRQCKVFYTISRMEKKQARLVNNANTGWGAAFMCQAYSHLIQQQFKAHVNCPSPQM